MKHLIRNTNANTFIALQDYMKLKEREKRKGSCLRRHHLIKYSYAWSEER